MGGHLEEKTQDALKKEDCKYIHLHFKYDEVLLNI